MDFTTFFRQATTDEKFPDGQAPYPYQARFAAADTLPELVGAPTGSGKTATAILGWLWRLHHSGRPTPRRLAYCLPMRVLVEQTHRETQKWLKALNLTKEVGLQLLMGGEGSDEWYLHPERSAVLIGTQDMLLSRALNRGYAASRFHWPIDFGLLNNDCLWVYDEPQLMGNGVSTSAQLAGLRQALGTFGPCPSVWMSATLEPPWLETVDFRGKFSDKPLELGKDQYGDDYDPERPLYRRMTAVKTLAPLGGSFTKEADDREVKQIAERILEKHREAAGSQTVVVLNTVKRAMKVYEALLALRKKAKSESPKLLLVHSRFRQHERKQLNSQLQQAGEAGVDRIIVATQVVEAGVDISARTLITELAPWASLVQRIGRCNRTGDDGPGRVFWIDLEIDKCGLPYESADLTFAREQLGMLEDKNVSPKALDEFKHKNNIHLPFEHIHVIRRRDLIDLFDTSPDLSGNDIDVSRFIRSDDPETDVQVFWRQWAGNAPSADLVAPHREELCSVSVGNDFREFLDRLSEKKKLSGYVWDHLDGAWVRLDFRQLRPGLTILLPASAGGYSELGWDSGSTAIVEPLSQPSSEAILQSEATDSDINSETPNLRRTVAEHTEAVCGGIATILQGIHWLPSDEQQCLQIAARWHDAGKGHFVFQNAVRCVNPDLPEGEMWAKSGKKGRLNYRRFGRRHFRHELASALAALQAGLSFEVCYLIAAHHGKVRLSIRSLPGEDSPDDRSIRFALGVRDGDLLPPIPLGKGLISPATMLDLSPMQLGDKSWTAQALTLRDRLGPFRLAFLEALLRAADQRVSNAERKGGSHA